MSGGTLPLAAGLREKDLRALATCCACGRKVLATGLPLLYRVTIERFGVDVAAMKRQGGLAAFIGSAAIAGVMGPDLDMAERIGDAVQVAMCDSCGSSAPFAALFFEHQR